MARKITPYKRCKRLAVAAFSQAIDLGKGKKCYLRRTYVDNATPWNLSVGPIFLRGDNWDDLAIQIFLIAGCNKEDWQHLVDEAGVDAVCDEIKAKRAEIMEVVYKLEEKARQES
jgi:hypothetical protein